MHLSRHARNRARHLRVTIAEIEAVVAEPEHTDTDADGRPRFYRTIRGRRIRVVLATDRTGFVVSVHERTN